MEFYQLWANTVMLTRLRYRNLYFANEAIQGAAAADIIGNMPEESKKAVISCFIISLFIEYGY